MVHSWYTAVGSSCLHHRVHPYQIHKYTTQLGGLCTILYCNIPTLEYVINTNHCNLHVLSKEGSTPSGRLDTLSEHIVAWVWTPKMCSIQRIKSRSAVASFPRPASHCLQSARDRKLSEGLGTRLDLQDTAKQVKILHPKFYMHSNIILKYNLAIYLTNVWLS